MSRLDLTALPVAPALVWVMFHSRSAVRARDRRGGSERSQPLVEVALHAVLKNHGAACVLSFRVGHTGAGVPQEKIPVRVGRDNARDIGGSNDGCALLPSRTSMASFARSACRGKTATGLFRAGRSRLVVEEGARNADASAF